jgi:mitochondrial fission protein ELM1
MDVILEHTANVCVPSSETSDSISSWIISEGLAGLRTQALGLAEAAGLRPMQYDLAAYAPWRFIPPELWPLWAARHAAGTLPPRGPDVLIGCGGLAAAVGLANRRQSRLVHVQHPRRPIKAFDLIVAAQHDELIGPNVFVTRTALHRVTPERLAQARTVWEPRLRHVRRPFVAVMLGGSNGRFTLNAEVADQLARQLATMMIIDKVGVAITPSRRTDPKISAAIDHALRPFGAWMWDMHGENPYFGLLALADAIIVTIDSVSMISEAVATRAPVMLAGLPGRSRRIGVFLEGLRASGRARDFKGHCEIWPVSPLDDTPAAAFEMRRRLGF